MHIRPLIIVYNPSSGSSIGMRTLRRLCKDASFTVEKTIPLDEKTAAALRTHTSKSNWIAAIGGDGTISAVANMLVDKSAVLVPLPGGTLNHFTKDLAIDQDISKALQQAARQTPRPIDIASVNDTYFINNSSIGVYPQSLNHRKRIEGKLGKWPAALYGLLRAFVIYKTYDVTIGNKSYTTPFVFIGNNDYQLHDFTADGRTSLDGGILSVYIVSSTTRLGLIRIFWRALLGNLGNERDFDHFTTTSLTIKSSSRRVRVSHDGEVSKLSFPLSYTIHHNSLTIVAPHAPTKK